MDKYPFVVTVLRKDTHGGAPVYQQYNCETLLAAIDKMSGFTSTRDKSVIRVSLSIVIRVVTLGR